jgi:mRNA interferase RelE/StbE
LDWTVKYTKTAKKQLRKLDQYEALKILNYIDTQVTISEDPRSIGKSLVGPTLGSYWRYRVGEYRIICDINDNEISILVIEVGHRKEIYR